jgi:hypothetical protein
MYWTDFSSLTTEQKKALLLEKEVHDASNQYDCEDDDSVFSDSDFAP